LHRIDNVGDAVTTGDDDGMLVDQSVVHPTDVFVAVVGRPQ
jgi:hypothetical protein